MSEESATSETRINLGDRISETALKSLYSSVDDKIRLVIGRSPKHAHPDRRNINLLLPNDTSFSRDQLALEFWPKSIRVINTNERQPIFYRTDNMKAPKRIEPGEEVHVDNTISEMRNFQVTFPNGASLKAQSVGASTEHPDSYALQSMALMPPKR